MNAGIIGIGRCLPEEKLTNFDLEQRMDTSDEWIRTMTGIEERRIARIGEILAKAVVRSRMKTLADRAAEPAETVQKCAGWRRAPPLTAASVICSSDSHSVPVPRFRPPRAPTKARGHRSPRLVRRRDESSPPNARPAHRGVRHRHRGSRRTRRRPFRHVRPPFIRSCED